MIGRAGCSCYEAGMRTRLLLAGMLGLLAGGVPGLAAENLLRNGSFEGALLYWHGVSTNQQLVRDAKVGEFALRCESRGVMSAPFVCTRGKPYTVSFFVKAEQPCTVEVQMPPSARVEAQKAGRLWTREATKSARVGTDWQRVSFTWPADVPPSGFWPDPHYLIQIEPRGGTIVLDGVTGTEGDTGTADYVPRRDIEIVAECPDLPGYAGAQANLFEKGATVRVVAHVSNSSAKDRDVTIHWQLFDYEGLQPVGRPLAKRITAVAGRTVSETMALKLTANGCVLSRVSVVSDGINTKGSSTLDVSEIPLSSLPYPQAVTKPDYRERFGGSFAGGQGMLEKFQRIGFGWTRWYPETKWHNFQKSAGAPFDWHDEAFDLAARHGVSQHVVLYGWPPGLMDKEHSGQPLPLDMKWPADDPRWDDLTIETAWDTYVKAAATHFKGRSVIFEIENEPEFDTWANQHEQYAKFTIRTAKLLRQTDPQAKIMVNNVYGIPSPVNAAFFKAGGLKFIDVVSWHDYHAGWLTDASGIKRMRQHMDEAGGNNVELWFNEGWAFSNTAVDEPPACTGLTAAQSCNAIMDSVAEMSVAGQKKTILFHTGYEDHGMSFWDYSGPGTALWDWYGLPHPHVAAWNVLAHHIGLSEEVGFVRPPGANLCIFDDLRNGRGVIIAYADRDAKTDVEVELPVSGLIAEDIMGNIGAAALLPPDRGDKRGASPKLVLSKTGRPVILYAEKKTPGRVFLEKLSPLDRQHAGFVARGEGGALSWKLPPAWDGKAKGSTDGSTVLADGKPVWKLEQVWPPEPQKPANYRPMTWNGTAWNVTEGGMGGQPGATLKDSALLLEIRAPHGQPVARRVCVLVFVAPQAGRYSISASVHSRIWDGKNKNTLRLFRKNTSDAAEVGRLEIAHDTDASLALTLELSAGDELVLYPEIEGMYAGGTLTLRDLVIATGTPAQPPPGPAPAP